MYYKRKWFYLQIYSGLKKLIEMETSSDGLLSVLYCYLIRFKVFSAIPHLVSVESFVAHSDTICNSEGNVEIKQVLSKETW